MNKLMINLKAFPCKGRFVIQNTNHMFIYLLFHVSNYGLADPLNQQRTTSTAYLLKFKFHLQLYGIHQTTNDIYTQSTLRTYQKAACDEETVTLKCPRGTSITVQVAQYGRSAPGTAGHLCAAELEKYSPEVEVIGNSSCMWPNALQTVVEACQKKRQCKFHTSPKAFGGDPCPGVRKFVEIAYKCRPYEFRSKVGCENDVLQLACNPHSRIAVYSASYGRTEYESIQCPQPQGVPEETCLVSYATETVMQICHGRRRCTLSADTSTFGSPCRPDSRMYLKVVYTCVPRRVLKERYEGAPEDDELPTPDGTMIENEDFYDTDPGEDKWEPAIPPAPKVAAEPTASLPHPAHNDTSVVLASPAPAPGSDVARSPHAGDDDTQRGTVNSVYLFIVLGAACSLLVCAAGGGACALRRRRARKNAKAPDLSANTDIPNGFNDSISEVDTDIEVTAISVPAIHNSSTLKSERAPSHFSDVTLGPNMGPSLAPTLGPKGSLYVGRPVPNTYPHLPHPHMYGPCEDYSNIHGMVPMRGIPIETVGTLRRGMQGTLQMGPPMHPSDSLNQPADVVVSPRSLNRYSNAQYYYG